MRSSVKASQAILAVAEAIKATFSAGDWLALGLVSDSDQLIRNHPRLLRSLDFGDDDYSGNVLQVLPGVLGMRRGATVTGRAIDCFPNLAVVEEQVGLRGWLAASDPAVYEALYAEDADAVLDELHVAAEGLGVPDIEMHAVRLRRSLHDDPAQVIGSAKELLETTLKAVLGLHGTGPETKLEIPKLIKQANVKLGLDAATVPGDQPGAEQRRKVLGSLAQIVTSAAELRNAGLGTGHGVSNGPVLDVATARLVVSAAVAVASFYAEAHTALAVPPDSPSLPF